MKFNWKRYLPIIGLAIFAYILIKLDVRKVFVEFLSLNWGWFFVAVVFVIVVMFLQTFKWFLIARKQKINVPFPEAFRINIIANFYGFVSPSKLGAAIRAEYLKEYSRKIGKGISNFVIDKVLDLASLFVIAIIMLFVFKEKFNTFSLNYIILIFLLFVVIFVIFYNESRSRKILRFIFKGFIPKRYELKAKLTFDSFYEDLPKKRFLVFVFIINMVTWVNIYLITYFVGLSLGIELGFIYYLAVLPIATIVAQIPITISGLGTREATMIGLFGLFGIGATKIFSMSIISLFIGAILPSIVASFLILKSKDRL